MSSMPRELMFVVAVVVALAAAPPPAHACGPDFDVSLLSRRAETLGELPEPTFLDEVAYLVTPARRYPYVADAGLPLDDAGTQERALYDAGDYPGVLALPPDQRRHRSVRAAYMLGRTRHGDEAIAAYRQVRRLVDDGFVDGAGLALSSLSQEARLHLQHGHDAAAVRLYAEQAALGHPDGPTSLLFVVREVVTHRRERALLADPVGQRLLALYLAARSGELTAPEVDRLLRRLAALDDIAGAEQLAAFAYQRGDWDRAAAFAARAADAPLAQWVAAKLALRRGDRATADRLLATAADGFRARTCEPTTATDAPAADDDPRVVRATGDRLVVAVREGRMTDALALAWQVRHHHPDDLTYVAERLVSLPELITFAATLPGADGPPADHDTWDTTPAALRALLARRLARAGRHLEAAAYHGPRDRPAALAYALAMNRAAHAGDPIERARALYQASRVARPHGLEILGTAHAPDWELYGAQYDRGDYFPDDAAWFPRHPRELVRHLASAPARGERYHYRHVAVDLAEQAAALVPRHTAARAAILCWAGRYLGTGDTCPEPDFAEARRPPPPPAVEPLPPPRPFGAGYGRRWLSRLAVLAGGLAALGLVALGAAWSRRRWRRFAARP